MSLSLEYRTLVCVRRYCESDHAHVVQNYPVLFWRGVAAPMLSGAIHHHMTFFVDSLSQDEKRAWLSAFYCLAAAEKEVRG